MRYPSDYKKQTRKKILAAAGNLFREKGYNGVGVDAIMAEAGLTAGGFYSHFDSKEALFSEVIKNVLSNRSSSLSTILEGKEGEHWLKSLIKNYLSQFHRDNVIDGCPLPILTPDVTRSCNETRDNYEECLKVFLSEISKKMPEALVPAEERAIALVSQLIGGLMLARAVKDKELSNQILLSCQKAALNICQNSNQKSKEVQEIQKSQNSSKSQE
jgi:AcrR family transcriptional regulator